MIDGIKSTGLGGQITSQIESLQAKLNAVTGANSNSNNATPNTTLPNKTITVNHNLGMSQTITDAASQALMQNKDVWSDVLQRQEKDYLSL